MQSGSAGFVFCRILESWIPRRAATFTLAVVETLLKSLVDPLSRKLALAPVDDEPFTDEDRQAVAEAEEWLEHNEPIPLESVLADLGLTMDDWERMGKTPVLQSTGRMSKS
jgi:hypothetical protein